MARSKRFNLRVGARRTSVTLDGVLSGYLALHLGHVPQTAGAHRAVREWLQARIDEDNDPGRHGVSRWLQQQVLEVIVDQALVRAYDDWLLERESAPGYERRR